MPGNSITDDVLRIEATAELDCSLICVIRRPVPEKNNFFPLFFSANGDKIERYSR